MLLTIGQLANELGVSVESLRRWDKQGSLKPHLRTAGGHRRYLLSEALVALGAPLSAKQQDSGQLVVGYSRVSSADQAQDLVRQEERLRQHLSSVPHALFISDLGSGLNFKKRGLSKLIGLILAGRVARLVLTHKDRLLRFGFELLEQMVHAHGGSIEVLEEVVGTQQDELAKDVLAIITVFSAKLYGQRSHDHRKKAA